MCTTAEWLAEQEITAGVAIPNHPGPYTGATYTTKFKYELDVSVNDDYEEHMRNNIGFTKGLFIDFGNWWTSEWSNHDINL